MNKNIVLILTRLLRVVYILCLLSLFLVVGIIGWQQKPRERVFDSFSYTTCADGEIYHKEYDENIDWICQRDNLQSGNKLDVSKAMSAGYTYDDIREYLNQNPDIRIYDSETEEGAIIGSWKQASQTWFWGIIIGLLAIEMIYMTIRYIFGLKPYSELLSYFYKQFMK